MYTHTHKHTRNYPERNRDFPVNRSRAWQTMKVRKTCRWRSSMSIVYHCILVWWRIHWNLAGTLKYFCDSHVLGVLNMSFLQNYTETLAVGASFVGSMSTWKDWGNLSTGLSATGSNDNGSDKNEDSCTRSRWWWWRYVIMSFLCVHMWESQPLSMVTARKDNGTHLRLPKHHGWHPWQWNWELEAFKTGWLKT